MIRRAVVGALFLVVQGAAAQVPVSAPTIGAQTRDQSIPAVSASSSGDRFLVAWESRFFTAWPQTAHVFYRMYDADGNPLDELPRVYGNNSPSVVWNGAEWYEVYANYLSRFSAVVDLPMMSGVRIDRDGEVIESSNQPLVKSRYSTDFARVAWSGRNYLAVAGGLATVLIAADGTPIRTLDTLHVPLAGTEGTFLTTDAILDSDGAVIANIPLGGSFVAGAAHGGEYGVVVAGSYTDPHVDLVTVSPRGEVLSRRTVSSTPAAGAAVVWSGDSYLAAWSTAIASQICFARFTTASASAPQCVARRSAVEALSLAASDRKTLVTWSEHVPSTGMVGLLYTTFVPSTGIPDLSGATVASVAIQTQTAPILNPSGDSLTLAWNEPDETPRAMVGALDRSLAPVPPSTLGVGVSGNVRMASNGETTLAVYATDTGEVLGRFVTRGKPVGSAFPIGRGSSPAVAFDGAEWLVVWVPPDGQLQSAIVTGGGVLVTPTGMPLLPSIERQTMPAVASRGGDFLVTWIEGSTLHAVGVGTSGQVNGSDLPLAHGEFLGLDVAASGRQYLIAVRTWYGNIGLPVTSTIPDILVAGFSGSGPLRVRPRAEGGFTILANGFVFVDANGNDTPGGSVANALDFAYLGDRLIVAAVRKDRVFLDVYGDRRRAAARH